MDYKKIMGDAEKTFSFSNMYEDAIEKKQSQLGIDGELAEELSKKRDFGLKKYGEFSFQGSLEKCMTSPTILHAQEEAIDLINYLLHEQFKNDILQNDNTELRLLTVSAKSIYDKLNSLKHI